MEEIKQLFGTSTPEEEAVKAPTPQAAKADAKPVAESKSKPTDRKPREQRRREPGTGRPARKPKTAVVVADPSLADPHKLSRLAIHSEKLILRNGVGQYLAWLKSTNSSESIALYQRISAPLLEKYPSKAAETKVEQKEEAKVATQATEEESSSENSPKAEVVAEAKPKESEKPKAPDLLDILSRRPSAFHQDILIPVLEVLRDVEKPKSKKVEPDASDEEATPEKPRRRIVESNTTEAFAGAKTDA